MYIKSLILDKSGLIRYQVLLPALVFTIPLVLAGPQLLVGSIINSILILSSLKISQNKLWALAFLPSTATMANGVLFGNFTPLLLYFLPFIWISNMFLMVSFSKFNKKINYPLALLLSSSLKSLLLYSIALFYFNLHIIPKLFLASMGLVQFSTAISGGIIAFFALKFVNKYDK